MTKFILFSGKGGVGKTSLSCATALMLASDGARTLLVTTDPASNLGDVFEQSIGAEAQPVAGVNHLFLQEINPEDALRAYKDRALAPLAGRFPEAVLRSMEEKMSGPCTEEIATFDQFIARMNEPDYDYVVFDTAPTGHTLRLLELPGSWSIHIEESAKGSGQTCIGSADSLMASKAQYDHAVQTLQDPDSTTFVFVTQATKLSVEEMLRSSEELHRLGIVNQQVIINGVIPEDERSHPYSGRRYEKQIPYLVDVRKRFEGPIGQMPLYADEVKGLTMLHQVSEDLHHAIIL
ncbi:MAG: ArsA family ATPase [Acidibacillus sp.]|nr:ArsA family ATPase [Acidibacillus sp.]